MLIRCLGALCLLVGPMHANSVEVATPTPVKKSASTPKKKVPAVKKAPSSMSAEEASQYHQLMILSDFFAERQKCFPYC